VTERLGIVLALLCLAACEQQPQSVAPLYESAPVETRTIQVTVDAPGVIEPQVTVEVKSKASGEILAMYAETGDVVEAGFLLVEVDRRTPRNQLAEAEAALVAARARRTIAQTQMERAETLTESGTLTEADYEQSQLEFANAQAQVIGSEVALENARIAMDDTQVTAPITGTIIERGVEPGSVISSPTRDVSGGSILLRMADLSTVRVRALVDETDIGKIKPGMVARVTVAAYPNQPFQGEVLKIEPQAIIEQNVTMFAVLIRLENQGDLLMPGMNAEVQIRIASRDSVAAVPTMALRAESDIPTAAAMLGMDETELRDMLGSEQPRAPGAMDTNQPQALIAKLRSGEPLSAPEEAQLREMRRARQAGTGPQAGGAAGGPFSGAGRGARVESEPSVTGYQFGGEYWVVALQQGEPMPVSVRTGLTDLEYSEIVAGLGPQDQVLLLPSSSLFEQQEMLRQAISARFSSTPFQQSPARGRGRMR